MLSRRGAWRRRIFGNTLGAPREWKGCKYNDVTPSLSYSIAGISTDSVKRFDLNWVCNSKSRGRAMYWSATIRVYGLTYFTVSPQTLFELALHEWITTSTTILDFISEVDHPLMWAAPKVTHMRPEKALKLPEGTSFVDFVIWILGQVRITVSSFEYDLSFYIFSKNPWRNLRRCTTIYQLRITYLCLSLLNLELPLIRWV